MEENKKMHIKPLPAELLGRSLRNLSVIDRLQCERVSPRWNWIVGEFGWTEERKLDHSSVFEGTTPENGDHFQQRFYDATGRGNYNLVSLLNRVSENLIELDLASFDQSRLKGFVEKLAESLQTMKKLEKLNLKRFELADLVVFVLPPNLCHLQTSCAFTTETLKILAKKCPKLEEVPFRRVVGINLSNVGEFIRKFPRLKKLDLAHPKFDSYEGGGRLASIAGLKELEVLELYNIVGFDAHSFEAMVAGCSKLRKLRFQYSSREVSLTEASFLHLAKMPSLTVLEIGGFSELFTDSVLKEIAKQGKLKRLVANFSDLTDESIVYLIDRCKSLISLDLFCNRQITERSLKAVIAEVQERHGSPPRALPDGPLDSGIFYFNCQGTGIDKKRALEMVSGNPWLALNIIHGHQFDPREIV